MWTAIKAFIKVYGAVALLVALAVWFAWGFVAAPPPRVLRIAAGPDASAYWQAAQAYRARFAREDIVLELLPSAGAVENLALLEAGRADLAFVQGGVARAADHPDIVAIGATFHEAVWLFRRDSLEIDRLGALKGSRVAIGPDGSGTRALGLALLAASGVAEADATLLKLGGTEAAAALADGQVDAALFVSARPGPAINRLLRTEAVALVDFGQRADAYVAAFPFLSAVRLPAGGVSLAEDIPPESSTLLAPAAQLAARAEIHPQIVALLMRILADVHATRDLFTPVGSFPNPQLVDFPLHDDAARWYRSGPGFLHRVAPFWVAVTIERMWVLAIPLITVGIPLLRFAPPLWRWQVERKIYRWYEELRSVEAGLPQADAPGRARLTEKLAVLDAKLSRLRVPLAYMNQLYALRAHLDLVRGRLVQTQA